MKTIGILLAGAALACAQTGSVSGHFYDADTGAVLPNFGARGPDTRVRSDDQGVYRVTGLQPGPQKIQVSGWPDFTSAFVNVPAGGELTGVDFRFRRDGQVSGRVTDQNKDPIQGVRVCEMAREYLGGQLYYFAERCVVSDDRGQYSIPGIQAGRVFFMLAEMPFLPKSAISAAPDKPELRLPAYRATYYPSSEVVEAAEPLKLRSGDQRDRVDIQMQRSPQYCVEALLTSDGRPSSLMFKVTDEASSSSNMTPGSSSSGGRPPSAGPDGKIRVCDLYPGRFRIGAFGPTAINPQLYGVASFDVGKSDVSGIRVNATSLINTPGQAGWEGRPPERGLDSAFSSAVLPVTNDGMRSRLTTDPQGNFVLPAWPGIDYRLDLLPAPPGMPQAYLKDFTYGGRSILHTWFRLGTATGDARFRIIAANDGGTIHVSAADANGKVAPNNRFLILPARAANEGFLSDSMIVAQGGPAGDYTSPALAPGEYFVLATDDLIDKTPESMSAIWKVRPLGSRVEVKSNTTVEVKVETRGILK